MELTLHWLDRHLGYLIVSRLRRHIKRGGVVVAQTQLVVLVIQVTEMIGSSD